jgi:hypothetical protein
MGTDAAWNFVHASKRDSAATHLPCVVAVREESQPIRFTPLVYPRSSCHNAR